VTVTAKSLWTTLFPSVRRELAFVRSAALAWDPELREGITVIVPAYNEGVTLRETLASLHAQTTPPAVIIVVNDASTDDTAEIARSMGVTVVCPPSNTGSKAGAQTFALPLVRTRLVMAVDADTTLAPDAIARLAATFECANVAAACGFVVPRRVRTIWERGRYVEYIFAFTFYKQIQDYYDRPLISSGCFSMYDTVALRAHGGWSTRTLAEDMDLTWSFHQSGHAVRFVPEAVCYPIEPHDLRLLTKQLRRWSHGFVQNVRLHWRGLLEVPYLRSAVAVATWDALLASAVYLLVVPLLALLLRNPWFLLGYVIDLPALMVPVLTGAVRRGEVARALASIPAFLVLRTVNALFFLEAAWSEWVRGRTFLLYEKGH
jgi:biofilm PGA synthesis N-glycosyltransferase PgaC